MFDHTHYVPILRWKRAEFDALTYLHERHRKRMTPLIEVTPRSFSLRQFYNGRKAKKNSLTYRADDILEHWGDSRIFLDLSLINQSYRLNRRHPVVVYGEEAHTRGIYLVPVVRLKSDNDYCAAAATVA